MAKLHVDSFTGTTGQDVTGWTGVYRVTGDYLRYYGTNTANAYKNGSTWMPTVSYNAGKGFVNCYTQCTTGSAGPYTGVAVRCSGDQQVYTADGYMAYPFTTTTGCLRRVDNGELTGLGSDFTSLTMATNPLIIRVIGTTIEVIVANTVEVSVTDATYESGYAGAITGTASGNNGLDDFESGTVPSMPTMGMW